MTMTVHAYPCGDVTASEGVNDTSLTSAWPSPFRAWYAVSILFLAYAFSFVDRTILSLLVGPIRRDLGISDTQVSLLHGFAFAVFYTLLGVPIARLADRGSRRGIISCSAIAWSFACAACAFARNFWQLFAGRVAVGVGEAGLSPAAYSMLADLFPPRRLGIAMSAYTSAIYIGAGLSYIIGGKVVAVATAAPGAQWPIVGAMHAWQLTFIIVGLPGLVLGALMWTVQEPARRLRPGVESDTRRHGVTLSLTFTHFRKFGRAYAGYILGFTLISIIYNVAVAWGPAFLTRRLGLSTPQAGYLLGPVILLSGVSGGLFGGQMADMLRARGRLDATVLVGLLSVACAAPCGALAFQMAGTRAFVMLFAIMLFGASMAFGAAAAGIQALTPNRMRAQASAIYLFTLNILAVGLGPFLAALITDYAFHDDLRVGDSVSIVICIAAPLACYLLMLARKPFIVCALALRDLQS